MTMKRQLHISGIQMLCSCAFRYYLRYIRALHRPRGGKLAIGSSAHKSAHKNLTHKVASNGDLLPQEEIQQVARDEMNRQCDDGEGVSDDGVKIVDKKRQGEMVDESIRFADIHYNHVAPKVNPGRSYYEVEGTQIVLPNVELPYYLEMTGFPFNLAGTIDLIDTLPTGRACVKDIKTARQKPQFGVAETSLQGATYTTALHHMNGVPYPIGFGLDYLVKYSKAEKDTHIPQLAEKGMGHERLLLRVFERACKLIESEIWMPADPGGWNSPCKLCEYRHGDCRYFRDPVTVAL